MLVLMNLAKLTPHHPSRVIQVTNQTRSNAFRYAVDKGDWILYDNTGLKGQVATWTRENVDIPAPNLPFSYHLCPMSELEGLAKGENHEILDLLKSVKKVIVAVGYKRNELPEIKIEDVVVQESQIGYDGGSDCGRLLNAGTKAHLPRLFGYGIAFPEKVVDRMGNAEDSVGMIKFARYLGKAVPRALDI
jgi:hypothetical protein